MSVETYEVGAKFVVRIVKHHNLNPDRHWANTYEFEATVAGSTDELLALGLKVVLFEQQPALNTTLFDRLLISTWEPDSKPYNPSVFISSSLTVQGQSTVAGDALPLTTAWSVARVAVTGRFGHLFYRNWLLEQHVQSPAGKMVFVDRPTMEAVLQGAITFSGLDDHLGIAPVGGLRMVMINADGDQVRPVLGLGTQGVTQLPVDHTWYNRSSITVP